MDNPFVVGMAQAQKHAPPESKMAILSLFAPYFPVDVTMALFGVKKHQVTATKIHDADAMAGPRLCTNA
jgi:hypothetical protein